MLSPERYWSVWLKRGALEDCRDNDQEFEIRIPVKKWHLQLLGSVNEEVLEAWREQRQLRENLRKLR